MSQTPLSAASSYLSAAELLKRIDGRTIVRDWCSDDGNPVPESGWETNPNLLAALNDASGMVESASLAGGRYTPSDLQALTGVGLRMLYRLVAGIAVGLLAERRPDRDAKMPPSYEWAMKQLDMIAAGHRIFSLQEAADAGRIDSEVETAADVEHRNPTSVIAERFFGPRTDRESGGW